MGLGSCLILAALTAATLLSVDARKPVTLNSDCDDFSSARGTQYPPFYDDNVIERWKIKVTPGKTVNLTFVSFDISNGGGFPCWGYCKCDYVEVFDGNKPLPSRRLGRICGHRLSEKRRNFRSKSNKMFIRLVTNSDSFRGFGFHAQFDAIGSGDSEMNIAPNASYRCQALNYDCGVANNPIRSVPSRIVGGIEARAHSWPWMVYLSYSDGDPWCGGSLVNNEWVVTAAHCVDGDSDTSVYVTVGAHDYSSNSEGARRFRSSRVIMHPSYNSVITNYDYALIKLSTPVEFSDNVRPVCLPDQGENLAVGERSYATGWGSTGGFSFPDELRQVALTIRSDDYCGGSLLNNEYMTPTMMCADVDGAGKDTCQGDSGGPLIWEDGGRFKLIGITSWGYGCGEPNSPGVYARVAAEREWMDQYINGVRRFPPMLKARKNKKDD